MALLMVRLDKMIEERETTLVKRGAKSYDEYLGLCQSIETLRAVAQACVDIAKQMRVPPQEENPAVRRTRDRSEQVYRA